MRTVFAAGSSIGSFKKAQSALMADQSSQKPPKSDADNSSWIGLSSVGFEFVFSVLLPGSLGWWLDRRFGTAPWLMLVGGLFGFITGFFLLMRTIKGTR
ncbi:MAG TPA: AtpZ/AtpI family protein [Tepidisphaeraceae bacterium]|nr:AtpZ/AtpI family protein [Tepidisphaeraceae bacterium]